jgi:CDP-glycerol glycerophosphotransferase
MFSVNEKDAEDKLRYSYVKKAQIDSKVCDLMISGCSFQTKLLKDAFWYSGEILEKGIPRCDIFFDSGRHKTIEEEVRRTYSIPAEDRIVLYAPTFRADHSIEPYRIDWGKVIPEIDRVFGGTGVTVLLRLHPNLIGKVDTSSLTCFDKVIDVTRYPDMQGLLCITDMLITDYSSSMFDIGMLRKPCVLYATDIEKYNRGYYFRFDEMPFPLARNEQELLDKIGDFSMEEYLMNLDRFYEERIGMVENGTSSKALSEWMTSHSM